MHDAVTVRPNVLKLRDEFTLVPYSLVVAVLLIFAPAVHAQDTGVAAKQLPNFGRVNERLYRGGQPGKEGIKKLARLGVNTIINLRDDDQNAVAEEAAAKAAGLRYFNVPFKELGRPSDADVDRVLSLIDAKDNGVVFVHCHKGEDRTGMIVALYRITHDNWTDDEAIHEAKQFGMKFWQVGMKRYISDYFRKRSEPATR